MKAMIFAAGLGTRLKPLTDKIPKALIPVAGKPLLEHIILKLKDAGFNEIIVNIHHFPTQIIDFLKEKNNFGIRIEVSNEQNLLLDTGGGVRNAAWFFDDGNPFLVHNVDILSNVDLKVLYNEHIQQDVLATLVVSKRETFRYLLFNEDNRLCGWINEKTGETKPSRFHDISEFHKFAFAGIQMLSPRIFKIMENLNPKFPIMDFYLSNVHNQIIKGYIPTDFKMMDVGKLNVLEEAEKFIIKN
jgi:NDP-sugar pyrophosphorylase family protein